MPQGKYYEDFEDFKKYMVKTQISLSSQVDDLIKQLKDDPQSFNKEEFNDPILAADTNTLKERIAKFAGEHKLQETKASDK